MIFFRKKNVEPPAKPKKSLQAVVLERVLTAEGWRRRTIKKARKGK